MNRNQIDKAKNINIVDYLRLHGMEPEYTTGSTAFYFSPWREESVPSLGVSLTYNRYRDFGESRKPGDLIELVQRIEGCSFTEALEKINGKDHKFEYPKHKIEQKRKNKNFINIKAVEPLSDSGLLSYIEQRQISRHTASKWLKQLIITFPYSKSNPDKEHFVVGFRSDSGGYEMRNSYLKICNSPKNITTIKGKGNKLILFEGFFDFLSFLEMHKIEKPIHHVIVLNSTSFIGSILPILKDYVVYGFMDNDKTGDDCFNLLKENSVKFADCRYVYADYNDLSEYWTMQHLPKQE